jgi:hypothetical protein
MGISAASPRRILFGMGLCEKVFAACGGKILF